MSQPSIYRESVSEPLRVAVIGVGALGRHHARILGQMEGVELIAVSDPNETQGRSVADSCQTDWTANYQTLFGKVDAVSIVVPTTLHHQIACEFLERDVDCLIEKPITSDLEQAKDLIRLADHHQQILQVGHIERFNPTFEAILNLKTTPRFIRAERKSPFAFRSMDISVVHDLMIHDIELVLALTQEMPTRVDAFGLLAMGNSEDVMEAHLSFPSGCTANLTANRINPTACRSIQVNSDDCMINADLHQRELTIYRPTTELIHGPTMEDRVRTGEDVTELKPKVFGEFLDVQTPTISSADALTAELASFVECCQTRSQPVVDGVVAFQALQVAERILNAARHHQVDYRRWDLPELPQRLAA